MHVATRTSRRRPRRVGAVLLAVALLASACRPEDGIEPVPTTPDETAVRIGAGQQPEGRVLAAVMGALLVEAGITAEVVVLADEDDARRALELGDVEVLPAYTGEAWLEVLGRADPPSDQATSLARVAEADEGEGLTWLRPVISPQRAITAPPADATFAFVVAEDGPHADVATLSQLATRLGQVAAPALCVDPAFGSREDGLAVVLEAYSIARDSVDLVGTEPEEAVLGVAAGECDAGLTSATDGRAWAAGQRPLLDDLGVFPAFVVAPVVVTDLLDDRPEVGTALRPLTQRLTTAMLGTWNARVAAGETVESVAEAAVTTLLEGPGEG